MTITGINAYSDRAIDRKYDKLNKERILVNVGAKGILAAGTYFGVKSAAKHGSLLQRGINRGVNLILTGLAKPFKFIGKNGKIGQIGNVIERFKGIHPAVKGVSVVLGASVALFLNTIRNNGYKKGVLAQARQDEKAFNRVKREQIPDIIEQAKTIGGMEILSELYNEAGLDAEYGRLGSFQG